LFSVQNEFSAMKCYVTLLNLSFQTPISPAGEEPFLLTSTPLKTPASVREQFVSFWRTNILHNIFCLKKVRTNIILPFEENSNFNSTLYEPTTAAILDHQFLILW